jgi:hypothetical protein
LHALFPSKARYRHPPLGSIGHHNQAWSCRGKRGVPKICWAICAGIGTQRRIMPLALGAYFFIQSMYLVAAHRCSELVAPPRETPPTGAHLSAATRIPTRPRQSLYPRSPPWRAMHR